MCLSFDGPVLNNSENYEKVTWPPLIWTKGNLQFWVPIPRSFYPELLLQALRYRVSLLIKYVMHSAKQVNFIEKHGDPC